MYDVIAVGSSTVDTFIETDKKFFKGKKYSFPVGAKLLVDKLSITTGGSATNTAVGFSRMGLKTGVISCIGIGNNSKRVIEELQSEKVDTKLIERSAQQRTGYSVILDAAHRDRTIFAFKGSNNLLCNDCLSRKEVFRTKWMYFGSLMGESFKTMKKIVKEAKKKGIRIAFNPSLYLAKKGVGYLKSILGCCDVVILNKEEAQALCREKDVRRCLVKFNRLGVGVGVITDGGKTINAFDGVNFYQLEPHRVRIVETTGAGDAFGSGLVSALAKGKKIEAALKIGLVNSHSVIEHVGAKEKLLGWGEAFKRSKKLKVKVC